MRGPVRRALCAGLPRWHLGARTGRPQDRPRQAPVEDVMTTATRESADGTVPLADVEAELARQLAGEGKVPAPMLRARLSNLVIYCNSGAHAEELSAVVPDIVAVHPARVLLLVGQPGDELPL